MKTELLFENWRCFLKEEHKDKAPLKFVDENAWGKVFKMPLSKERFIHFTPLERAVEIIESGKLLMNPPYEKFGTDTVDAVSLTYGSWVPKVQTNHIDDNLVNKKDLAAVMFKTNILPKDGYREEVKWEEDVPLIDSDLLDGDEAIDLLLKTPVKIGENDRVIYEV